jgi:hypothetical protein
VHIPLRGCTRNRRGVWCTFPCVTVAMYTTDAGAVNTPLRGYVRNRRGCGARSTRTSLGVTVDTTGAGYVAMDSHLRLRTLPCVAICATDAGHSLEWLCMHQTGCGARSLA